MKISEHIGKICGIILIIILLFIAIGLIFYTINGAVAEVHSYNYCVKTYNASFVAVGVESYFFNTGKFNCCYHPPQQVIVQDNKYVTIPKEPICYKGE